MSIRQMLAQELLLLETPAIGSYFTLKAPAKIQPQRLQSPARESFSGRLIAVQTTPALKGVQGTAFWPKHCIGQVPSSCCSTAVQWVT